MGSSDERSDAADHLADVKAGAGCTEIWETLSRDRSADSSADRSADD